MRRVRTLPLVVLSLALVVSACGGDDDDGDASSVSDAADALTDAAETGDPDAIADAASDLVDEAFSELADSGDGDDTSPADGSVDCAAIAASLEDVGINLALLQNLAGGGNPDLFDDFGPDGVFPIDFAALERGTDALRVLEPYGDGVGAALDRLTETAELAADGIAADLDERAAIAAEIAELNDGGALMVTDQVAIGTALAQAGC